MANPNSAKPLLNPPLVINRTQLQNLSPNSEFLQESINTCIKYSAEANVIVVPDFVPVNSPAIKFLLEAVLDDGHIEECLHKSMNSSPLSCNMNRSSHYPIPSQYRGVIKCADNRFEAFAWETITVAGSRRRPVYIGGYSTELEAATAHDLVSLRLGGACTSQTNFPIKRYLKEIDEMYTLNKREYIHLIRRRKVKGFSGSDCDFRGVLSTNGGRREWQAWLGRDKVNLPKILLGTYMSAEDAARAFDIAVIGFKGMDAITNFDLTSYDVKGIMGRLPNHSLMSSTQDSVTTESVGGGEENLLHDSGSNGVATLPPNVNQHGHNNYSEDQQLSFTPQLCNSTQSPSSSFQSNQTPDGVYGLIETASPLSNSSSTPFFGDCQGPNDTQSGHYNLDGLVGGTSQWSFSSSSPSPSSLEVLPNTNGIQSSTCDLGGLNGGNQNPNVLQSSSFTPGALVGNEFQDSNILSSSNIFEGNQNSIGMQSNPSDLVGLNNAVSELNISSPLPSAFDGYQNSNYIQGSSSNLDGLIRTGYQQGDLPPLPSSPLSSFLPGAQSSKCIQNNPSNLGGLIETRFQPRNQSSLQPPVQGYQSSNRIQSSPYDLGRVIRPRSQFGLNSSRIKSSPYDLSRLNRARSLPSNTSPIPASPQMAPFDIGQMNRTQVINMAKVLSSPSYNRQNPNNMQSSTPSYGGFTTTGSQFGNYGTSIGGNAALASNQKSGSLLNAMMLGLNTHSISQSPIQSQSSIPSSQGNKDQNQIGSKRSTSLRGLSPDFGKRLLGGRGDYTSAISLKIPQMLSEASSGQRAGGTETTNNNGGVDSFILNSNNEINNHVDVTPPPIISQVSEPTLPLQQQQPELVVQSHEEPNNLANVLNPQSTDQNMNNSSVFSFIPQSPLLEPNSGSGGPSTSEMIGNNDDADDFDITEYLNKDKIDEDFCDQVDTWLMMDVDEGL